jgi:ankyrin repeat protein
MNATKIAAIAVALQFSAMVLADEIGKNPPMLSAVLSGQCDVVRKQLEAGADANEQVTDYTTRQRTTIIFSAVAGASVCVTETLISHGADINHIYRIKGYNDPIWILENTPLSYAIQRGFHAKRTSQVELLLKHGASSDLKASDGVPFVQNTITGLRKYYKNDKEKMSILTQMESMLGRSK